MRPFQPGETTVEYIDRLEAEIERLRLGLKMIAYMEYDTGYSPETYAGAILSGGEPMKEE